MDSSFQILRLTETFNGHLMIEMPEIEDTFFILNFESKR